MSAEFFFFFILALSIVVSSALVVTLRNPIHSAVSLVVTMLLMAGVYALLNAPFLAIIQVMVYAGAIMVLFLFVIMLLNLGDEELGERKFTVSKFLTVSAAGFLFVVLVMGIATLQIGDSTERGTAYPGLSRLVSVPDGEQVKCSKDAMGVDADYCKDVVWGPGEGQPSGTWDSAQKRWKPSAELAQNVSLWQRYGSVEFVGKALFGKWVFVFELTGILLLAAIIGAVVMAKRRL